MALCGRVLASLNNLKIHYIFSEINGRKGQYEILISTICGSSKHLRTSYMLLATSKALWREYRTL